MHSASARGWRPCASSGGSDEGPERRMGRCYNGDELRGNMYHYKESGLRNISLLNGYVVKRTPYGEALSIRDPEGLHRYIGSVIARQPTLSGPELRFLRKEMDMSQRELAEFVGT